MMRCLRRSARSASSTRHACGCLSNTGASPRSRNAAWRTSGSGPGSAWDASIRSLPPRSVAPDHQDGRLCRIQRCTGCSNGIVFPESMPALARAYSELLHLRRSMSMTAWEGSSFADEYESIGETLRSFDAGKVGAEVAAWTEKLNRGEIIAH